MGSWNQLESPGIPDMAPMRLDLFLKISRLIARRTLAQEFCDAGLISVNGATAKPSKEIRAGDEIGIRRRNRNTLARVLRVPDKKQVARSDASDLYEIVSETPADGELL
jgi:ribosomal 50S subunit-recycling heat shock protein